MHIPTSVSSMVRKYLSAEVRSFHPASGGCINNGGEVVTSKGSYFVKWNDASRFPGMFETEALGLRLLESANCIDIPKVDFVGNENGVQVIVMEFIRRGRRKNNFWGLLGEQLAALHKTSSPNFGLEYNNYIGSLHQINTHRKSWIEFFIQERLEVQLTLVEKNQRADRTLRKDFEQLYKKLPSMLPEEKPSLLHGDLWGGNLMVNEVGDPCLIDPAVYFGHREIELAFTKLFGGFDESFFQAYHAVFPLVPGFVNRSDVYNLYPLLVHVNLFGGGYLGQIRGILQKIL